MPKIVTGLFTGGQKPPSAVAAEPLPTHDTAAVQEAERLKREEELRRRRGSLSTILTSGMGVTGDTAVQTPGLKSTLG